MFDMDRVTGLEETFAVDEIMSRGCVGARTMIDNQLTAVLFGTRKQNGLSALLI